MSTATAELLANREYKYGFKTDIETETIPKGLNEDTIRLISEKKNEPEWMLEFRLKAFRQWLKMKEPNYWANFQYPRIDFQDITYYAAPKQKAKKQSLDEVDPELLKTFEKLGIPLSEQKMLANVAVDAVFDSVSVATTYKEKLKKAGVVRSIRNWSKNISARSSPSAIIFTRRSIPRSFPTALSFSSRKASAARWSFRPISASTRRSRGSLKER
jgi:hypothetical protein